jgi:hypothetical protein
MSDRSNTQDRKREPREYEQLSVVRVLSVTLITTNPIL